jgi:TBC1 domain family member 10
LQSPEEDAFWTFVSLMDTHIRSYFAAGQAQMEIDATLFGKAVEANEPAIAKVFVEMDIPPASLCRPWFTALFLEALPLEHSERVWDIFLFEGKSFPCAPI